MNFLTFFKKSESRPIFNNDNIISKRYKSLKWQVFVSATLGYGIYYVCRLSLNVVKKPIVDSGVLDESQLGIIGSALFFSYAFGKFINGFLADHSNIKRFMGFGLLLSSLVNLSMGFANTFLFFAICWGVNGWVQSMGAPSSVVSLSRWFKNNERGSFYGFWSTSHNIGEAITYILTAIIVSYFGWQWGFKAAGLVGILGAILIFIFFHDTPESKGIPTINPENSSNKATAWEEQKSVIKNPFIWLLALSSAFMYISRYAVNSWGPYYFEAAKGYSLTEANSLIAISSVCGIIGTASSGYISDRFFKGHRNMPALIYGLMNVIGLCLFLMTPNASWWLDVLSMVVFGLAIGALICYLGGLMAIDIASKKASGAALGMVGITSYLAAGIQDIASGYLIKNNKQIIDDLAVYDFSTIKIFWIGAAILSVFFAVLTWKKT